MSIQVRIFLGFLQDKELKIHLNQSSSWQEAKMLSQSDLLETNWQDNDYLGLFIPSYSSCAQIKGKEQEIRDQLHLFCPKLNLDKHSIYLFAQLFLL